MRCVSAHDRHTPPCQPPRANMDPTAVFSQITTRCSIKQRAERPAESRPGSPAARSHDRHVHPRYALLLVRHCVRVLRPDKEAAGEHRCKCQRKER